MRKRWVVERTLAILGLGGMQKILLLCRDKGNHAFWKRNVGEVDGFRFGLPISCGRKRLDRLLSKGDAKLP